MIPALLAAINLHGWSIVEIAKAVIIIAAIIGVVFVILKVLNVWPPAWAITIFWIVVAAFVGIIAIEILASI